MSDALADAATELVSAPAEAAFAFLSDGRTLGRWAFGCWNTEAVDGGLFRGHSLFDEAPLWVRVDADKQRLVVTFHVGSSAAALSPRIVAMVVPGPRTGRPEGVCLVTLLAWRDTAMDDSRWKRLRVGHAAEILLLKALIER
jgi:hypothetical protein